MIPYDVLQQVEGDTEKHSNYELIQYELPFPENSILIERDKEAKRVQQSFVTSIKQSLINNNNN
jgi:hypothetical protein